MGYLTGEAPLSSVSSFTPRQLMECFRDIDARKDQPKKWRDRFAHVQQANLAGKLSG
jgi:hypothetical protein